MAQEDKFPWSAPPDGQFVPGGDGIRWSPSEMVEVVQWFCRHHDPKQRDISPENADGFFHSVRFYNDQIGLVAGMMNDNGFYRGSISRTINGGSTWENEIFTEFNTIHNLQFAEGAMAYFIAENWEEYHEFYLCRTRDFAQNREIIFP